VSLRRCRFPDQLRRPILDGWGIKDLMNKAKRVASRGKFIVKPDLGSLTIRDTETGKTFTLKGYGALKGEYSVKKGINLTKPILAQVAKKRPKASAGSTISQAKGSTRRKKY
jgi:hypothetical protein